jgi:rhodanese-related sulfurtransferase
LSLESVPVPEMSASDFYSLRNSERSKQLFMLDVREPEEFVITSIEGSCLVPVMEITSRLDEISPLITESSITVVICRSGQRSAMVTEYLSASGFSDVYNLSGGINAYSQVDSSVISY